MTELNIKLTNLNKGSNETLFNIKDEFFKEFNFSEVKNADFEIKSNLIKSDHDLSLSISIDGIVKNISCDHCAEDIAIPIKSNHLFVLKQKNDNSIIDDNKIYFDLNDLEIDVKHLIYELISLAIPNKRSHKSINKASECNKDMLSLINNFSFRDKKDGIDPRWSDLKNIELKQ